MDASRPESKEVASIAHLLLEPGENSTREIAKLLLPFTPGELGAGERAAVALEVARLALEDIGE